MHDGLPSHSRGNDGLRKRWRVLRLPSRTDAFITSKSFDDFWLGILSGVDMLNPPIMVFVSEGIFSFAALADLTGESHRCWLVCMMVEASRDRGALMCVIEVLIAALD